MIIDPAEQDLRANYKLLIGSVLPRPIAWVSTADAEGRPNLAPFSFFTGASPQPPMVVFSPLRRFSDGQEKDTLVNIRATGEFVVNVVTEELVEQANDTAVEFAPGVSEFGEAGLTAAPCETVRAPRVAESPVSMECRLVQVVDLGPQAAGGGAVVIGEVLRFHVRDDLIDDGRIDTEALHPVGRLAGAEYTTLGRRFTLERKR
ncbi:MAG TPA: flavin reductase family protein [Candidatus Krumholzibacteria bacterium]|nr:flavin reductase family protein [Candidatus Krumholzibacteria bacterium]HRX51751.1 flavin reductase family protein [Candidatus Krumholzibacteria bacterium]